MNKKDRQCEGRHGRRRGGGRPVKLRCCRRYDGNRVYKPQGVPLCDLDEAVLTLDAFEALRLCDAEGLDQTEAAVRMQVSRGTIQRLLRQARRTVAVALAEHCALRIDLTNREEGNACLHPHE